MYPVADMLTTIKNAQAVGHESVLIPFSQMKLAIANVLREKGFIADVEKRTKKGRRSELPYILVTLKYENGDGVINGVRLISKPSRRMYISKSELHKVRSGYGIAIITTPKGIMEGEDAKKAGVGGEILFEIW